MPKQIVYNGQSGIDALTLHQEIDADPTVGTSAGFGIALTGTEDDGSDYGIQWDEESDPTVLTINLAASIDDPSAEKTALDSLVSDHAGKPDVSPVVVQAEDEVAEKINTTPVVMPDMTMTLGPGKWRVTVVGGITTDDTVNWALALDSVVEKSTAGLFVPPVAAKQQQETFTIIADVDVALRASMTVELLWWGDADVTPIARPRQMIAEPRAM